MAPPTTMQYKLFNPQTQDKDNLTNMRASLDIKEYKTLIEEAEKASCRDKKAVLQRFKYIADKMRKEDNTQKTSKLESTELLTEALFLTKNQPDTLFYQQLQTLPPKRTGNMSVNPNYVQQVVKAYSGSKPALVTALANAYSPGGAPLSSNAQEESLCQQTDVYFAMPDQYPNSNTKNRDPSHSGLANLGHSYRIENVSLYDVKDDTVTAHDKKFGVVFVAAPALHGKLADYCNTAAGRQEYILYMAMLVRMQCEHAIEMGADTLIPGALGCGVFGNNPYLVAAIHRAVLSEPRYSHLNVHFAITQNHQGPNLPLIFNRVMQATPKLVQQIIVSSLPSNKYQITMIPSPFSDRLRTLLDSAKTIRSKANELASRGYHVEPQLAQYVAGVIENEVNALIGNIDSENSSTADIKAAILIAQQNISDALNADLTFNITAKDQTKSSVQFNVREKLSEHRGFKQLFIDIATFLSGLGFTYGLYCYATKGKFDISFFKTKTDAETILDHVDGLAKTLDYSQMDEQLAQIDQSYSQSTPPADAPTATSP